MLGNYVDYGNILFLNFYSLGKGVGVYGLKKKLRSHSGDILGGGGKHTF